MALDQTNKAVTMYPGEKFILPVGAAQTLFYGAMLVEDGGYMKKVANPAAAQGHLVVRGIARGRIAAGQNVVAYDDADNSAGAAGAMRVKVETGLAALKNDATKPLTVADGGLPCYAVDDESVSSDSNCGERPYAGTFLGIEPGTLRAIVAVGLSPEQTPKILSVLANSDLSAAAKLFVPIKLVVSVADVKADVCSATTDLVTGILLNNPVAGAIARICWGGICPTKGDAAAGYTAGAQLMAAAAGDGAINATTGKPSFGLALRTAGVGVIKAALITGPGGYKI